jgi:hypothetical protein
MKRNKNQQDTTIRCLLLTSISTCFGHHYDHLHENEEPVTAFGVLFCNKREKGDISRDVFFCVAVCSNPSWVTTHYPTKKYLTSNISFFPLVTEQYTKCSNGFFVLVKMDIMLPETC